MRHYISLGLIILLSSCSITQNHYPKTVQSWNGGSAQNLVKKWGQPDGMTVSQNGNSVILYKASTYRSGIGMASSPPCITSFEVNKKGTIVKADHMGARCFGDSSFAYYRSNPEKEIKA